jgi:hypothetical protein
MFMRRQKFPLQRIISGGQTGADRAALDFAIAHRLPHGGWCPRGRWAEDGIIPRRFRLAETPDANPAQRTEWNVRDSDGTVIFSLGPRLIGGSRKTAWFARRYAKPWLHLSRARRGPAATAAVLAGFLADYRVNVLNVAGPRQSGEPRVGRFVREVLERIYRGEFEP